MSDDGFKTEENRPIRDERGRYLRGCPPGPGRPSKSFDFQKCVELGAFLDGVDLEEAVWRVFKALVDAAAGGNVAAAKIVLDRLCGPVERGPAVHVDAHHLAIEDRPPGPPVPETGKLVEDIRQLSEAGEKLDAIHKQERNEQERNEQGRIEVEPAQL